MKIFEQFDDYEIDDIFGKDEEIEVNDLVELIDKKDALYFSSNDSFSETGNKIGWKIRVERKKYIGGKTLIRIGSCWYNVKNFRKL